MAPVTYHSNNNLLVRFQDHAKLGLFSDIGAGRPDPNLCEKLGNRLLKIAELPVRAVKDVGRKMQDPRYVTIALTATALLANSAIFYPTATRAVAVSVVTEVQNLLLKIDLAEWIRAGAYVGTCTAITGFGLRAEGRFTNEELMKQFYGVRNAKGNPAAMTHVEIRAEKN